METNRDKDWRDRWKEQLDGHSVTPPPEVWERLTDEIAPRRIAWGRRAVLWAAAACVAVLVGTFVGLQYFSTGVPSHEALLQAAQTGQPAVDRPALANELSSSNPTKPLYSQVQSPVNGRTARTADSRVAPSAAPKPISTEESIPVAELRTIVSDSAQTADRPTADSPAEPPQQPSPSATISSHERENYTLYPRSGKSEPAASRPIRTRSRTNEGWTVGLSLGNSLITAADNRSGFGNLAPYSLIEMASIPSGEDASTASGKSTTPYQHVMLQNLNAQPTTDVKHHFPVSVGITVEKSLTPAFALETGLVYTYLASDLTAGDATYYTQKQQLHYLGIPLKLRWKFLRKRYFDLYVAGGGMVEKCLSGKLSAHYEVNDRPSLTEDETLRVDPLQWSVSAAAGITLKLAPHVNLYAEPGIAYYFDDGSHISTIRKEKPLNINLQAGLRFDF
ncbi:porin family protein [Barnesiella viscericola]|uniref:porin family protein n=1 Tax=Barnesiella viscericola TaxID=397865 RepID=UPI0024B84EC8|nr:outer membrane beta-barrel protein [Barnesiella viscericola]